MERLWSPWRMEYVKSAAVDDDADCIFCDLPQKGNDEKHLIVARRELAFVMLNAYPYNPGHLMVAPFRHAGDLTELADSEHLACIDLLRSSIAALRDEVSPHGFNVGMNLGRVAGAGIPGHLHWHVVPRWNGDTNFMPVLGQTKVLPELLEETRAKLAPRLSG